MNKSHFDSWKTDRKAEKAKMRQSERYVKCECCWEQAYTQTRAHISTFMDTCVLNGIQQYVAQASIWVSVILMMMMMTREKWMNKRFMLFCEYILQNWLFSISYQTINNNSRYYGATFVFVCGVWGMGTGYWVGSKCSELSSSLSRTINRKNVCALFCPLQF